MNIPISRIRMNKIELLVVFLAGILSQNLCAAGEEIKPSITKEAIPVIIPSVGRDDPFAPIAKLTTEQVSRPSSGVQSVQQSGEYGQSQVVLNGVVWSALRPQAIINQLIFDVGNVIGGKTILKIEPSRVTLDDNGQIEVLTVDPLPLPEADITRPKE